MKKFVLMGLSALSVSGACAITATKEYVDRSTNAVLVASKAETTAATNATLTASKAYTDEAIAEVGGLTHDDATNAAVAVVQRDVPSWARQQTPPEGMTGNVLVLTNGSVKTKSGSSIKPDVLNAANKGFVFDGYYKLKEGVAGGGNLPMEFEFYAWPISSQSFGMNWKIVYSDGTYTNGVSTIPFQLFDGAISVNRQGQEILFRIVSDTDRVNANAFYKSTGKLVSPMLLISRLSDLETDPTVHSWAKAESKPTYTASEVGAATPAYVDSQNQVTRAIVESWEGFLDGSNVVFSITNYISGTYSLNSAKLKILEMTNGVYREVYNSRDEISLHLEGFRTNEFVSATNAIVSGVDAKIADKADRAWGKYTSYGGVAPSNTVYMTAPSTVFAGGLEYKRVAVGEGTVGILTTKGAPTYTTGDEGTFKFQDDGGTNFFGFAKTDSYVIGCNTDGISVTNHIVTLTYNVTMSGVPCIWYCPTLDVQPIVWEQLNTPDGQPIAGASHTVTWDASPDAGTEVCYLNCPEAKGFFKATIEVAGSAKFMTNMPADLGGGIICSNTVTGVNGIIRPTFNGSSVTWSWSVQ